MAKKQVKQDAIVERFGARLRELRASRGMTQAALAEAAQMTPSYIWRLESGSISPGVHLLERLAAALGTTVADLVPADDPPDTVEFLRQQARELAESVIQNADRETLLLLCPLLSRLGGANPPDAPQGTK